MRNRRLFNLVAGQTRFGPVAATDTTPDVLYLYDEISAYWGVTAADFVGELMGFGGRDFELHVNSPGGDVFEGLAMLNSLRAYPGKVTAVVDGIAASAASFLLMGANEVVMSKNSELMIHDAWGLCIGDATDMAAMSTRLDQVSANIASVYAERGDDAETWRARMRAETWYGADEAVAAGLADRVGGQVPVAASFDLSRFQGKTSTPVVDPIPARSPDPIPAPVEPVPQAAVPEPVSVLALLEKAFENGAQR